MKPKRPTVVVVFAILQLSLGGIGFLCFGCMGGLQLAGVEKFAEQMPQPGGRPNPGVEIEKFFRQKIPYYEATKILQPILGLVAALAMIVSGLGLLQMKRWGRWLAIGDACFIIALTLAIVLFGLLVRAPLMKEFAAEKSKDPNLQPQEKMALSIIESSATVGSLFNVVFLIYPVIVLVFMLLPSVSKAFRTRQAIEEDEVQDDLDAGWGGRMPEEEK